MKQKRFLLTLGLLSLVTILMFPVTGLAEKKKMTIGTASIGGAFYPVGTGIASIVSKYVPALDIRVEVTGGGIENPRLVGSGDTDLGITNIFLAHLAIEGKKPYSKALPIRTLALMYPSTLHMVVKKGSGVKTLKDLKGRRVAVGPAGGGTITLLKRLLTVYGMSVKDIKPNYIGYKDGCMALQDGNVDASILMAGAPTSAVLELSARTSIRFLRVTEDEMQKFLKKWPYYISVMIPKSYYKTDADALAVGSGNVLIVNEAMSEDLAYKITAALYDHVDEFRKVHPATKVVALKTAPHTIVPLHPGAIRYYKEKGVLK